MRSTSPPFFFLACIRQSLKINGVQEKYQRQGINYGYLLARFASTGSISSMASESSFDDASLIVCLISTFRFLCMASILYSAMNTPSYDYHFTNRCKSSDGYWYIYIICPLRYVEKSSANSYQEMALNFVQPVLDFWGV